MNPRRRRHEDLARSMTTIGCALLTLAWVAFLSGVETSVWRMPAAEAAEAGAAGDEVVVISEEVSTPSEPVEIFTSATTVSGVDGSGFPLLDEGLASGTAIEGMEPLNIFADPTLAQRILTRRGRPPFQYDAKGRKDPMILPWVLKEKLSTEFIAQARVYIKRAESTTDRKSRNAQYELAIKELDRVLEIDPTGRYAADARTLKQQIQEKLGPDGGPGTVGPEVLPPWVVANTKGIEADRSSKQDHVVLIGENRLHVGDTVPEHPDVKVVEIRPPDEVLFATKDYPRVRLIPTVPELDPWIVTNTKAVVFDNSPDRKHLALVGDNLLATGDAVPQFQNVKIVEITRDVVVFELEGVRIPVNVQVEVKQQ